MRSRLYPFQTWKLTWRILEEDWINLVDSGWIVDTYSFRGVQNVNTIVEGVTKLLVRILLCILITPSHLHTTKLFDELGIVAYSTE